MVRNLIKWAVSNPFVVLLLAIGLAGFGGFAFKNVNVEAYPDPLRNPKDDAGNDVYSLHDLTALQNWTLEREFLRVPRIGGVTSFGGVVKRYEVRPDPDRLKMYGITLGQLQNAVAAGNANV